MSRMGDDGGQLIERCVSVSMEVDLTISKSMWVCVVNKQIL